MPHSPVSAARNRAGYPPAGGRPRNGGVDTYLRFAEAVDRLDISQDKETLPELVGDMQQDSDGH